MCYLPPNGSVVGFGPVPFDGIAFRIVDVDVRSTPLPPQVIALRVASLLVRKGRV